MSSKIDKLIELRRKNIKKKYREFYKTFLNEIMRGAGKGITHYYYEIPEHCPHIPDYTYMLCSYYFTKYLDRDNIKYIYRLPNKLLILINVENTRKFNEKIISSLLNKNNKTSFEDDIKAIKYV